MRVCRGILVGGLAAAVASCAARAPQQGTDAAPRELAATIAAGSALYARQCARCHGQRGQGSGTVPALNYLGPRTDAQLRKIITDGVPGSMMAGWGNRLSAGEIEAIVAYLRHGFTVEG